MVKRMIESTKIERTVPDLREQGLKKRLDDLKEHLKVSQAGLARRIGASPTQVTEWLKGTDNPSAKMLVAMGNIAPSAADRLWFWQKAGIAEQRLIDDLRAGDSLGLTMPEGTLEFSAPVIEKVALAGGGVLQIETNGNLFVPSVLSGNHASVVSMRVPANPGFPQPFAEGDFVVIERLEADSALPEGSLVAVFLEHTPEGYELSPQTERFRQQVRAARALGEREKKEQSLNDKENPGLTARSDQENDERAEKILQQFNHPIIFFGRLTLQIAGGEDERRRDWRNWLTRVALNLSFSNSSEACLPLSEWRKGANPIESELRPSDSFTPRARIIGEVVGWFRNRAESNISAPDAEATAMGGGGNAVSHRNS